MPDEAQKLSGKVYVCKWCGEEYGTRQGLAYHRKVCEYKPTDDGDDDDGNTGGGIDIFGDGPNGDDDGGAGGAAVGVDDVDTYQCPECGYDATAPFNPCPGCGAGLVWA